MNWKPDYAGRGEKALGQIFDNMIANHKAAPPSIHEAWANVRSGHWDLNDFDNWVVKTVAYQQKINEGNKA